MYLWNAGIMIFRDIKFSLACIETVVFHFHIEIDYLFGLEMTVFYIELKTKQFGLKLLKLSTLRLNLFTSFYILWQFSVWNWQIHGKFKFIVVPFVIMSIWNWIVYEIRVVSLFETENEQFVFEIAVILHFWVLWLISSVWNANRFTFWSFVTDLGLNPE